MAKLRVLRSVAGEIRGGKFCKRANPKKKRTAKKRVARRRAAKGRRR